MLNFRDMHCFSQRCRFQHRLYHVFVYRINQRVKVATLILNILAIGSLSQECEGFMNGINVLMRVDAKSNFISFDMSEGITRKKSSPCQRLNSPLPWPSQLTDDEKPNVPGY